MKEIWKDIPGYEGVYYASNKGFIRSENGILKPSRHRDGYLKVVFCIEGHRKTFQVHRLIALTFIPNPNDLPQINHKDEDKTNNCVDNLEWCTMDYNIHYGTGQARSRNRGLPRNAMAICQYSLEGKLIAEYPSGMDASRATGVHVGNIFTCARHVRHQMGGFVWRYKGDPFTPVPKSKVSKEVVQLNKEGDIIKVWPSVKLASSSVGLNHSNSITECLKGYKKTCKGYVWKYKEEFDMNPKERLRSQIRKSVKDIASLLNVQQAEVWSEIEYLLKSKF